MPTDPLDLHTNFTETVKFLRNQKHVQCGKKLHSSIFIYSIASLVWNLLFKSLNNNFIIIRNANRSLS